MVNHHMEEMETRKRRSLEERIAEIDAKIAKHQDNIKSLKEQKSALLTPPKTKKKKTSIANAIKLAKEKGMSAGDILKKLGLE